MIEFDDKRYRKWDRAVSFAKSNEPHARLINSIFPPNKLARPLTESRLSFRQTKDHYGRDLEEPRLLRADVEEETEHDGSRGARDRARYWGEYRDFFRR